MVEQKLKKGRTLTELLDELLVLLVLAQIVSALERNTELLGLITVQLITQNADLHLGAGNVGQLNGTSKALVLLGVIILKTDLKLNGLKEMALVGPGVLQHSSDGFAQGCGLQFTKIKEKGWV